ncbi:hypothetical protein GCM10007424_21220 [Flavobacterium suaedae]|uniref:Adhesin domain-containing protein n=1 Tax=Flavobacterium suaedae TaxID=1767027 RepID=A0ABQ1K031_9FLAO|nr:hypothetical protein [Flavobacterium suaedae]GGB80888.1 hypothetical protein GCM10007424_21220 [Flavobacterium suaedae]
MKKIKHNIILLLLLAPLALMANNAPFKYSKQKKINKSFNVSANVNFIASNQYGHIYLTTWDENKVVVDIVITVSSNRESVVERRLNGIDIDFNASHNSVSVETDIDNFSGNAEISVNYTVKIPKKGNLVLENEYGGIILDKIYGTTQISCSYGSVKAKELNSQNNVISLEYCDNNHIEYAKRATIEVEYSSIKLDKAESATIAAEGSGTTIGTIGRLTIASEYGNLKIKSLDVATLDVEYGTLAIENINQGATIVIEYGSLDIKKLSENTKNVVIDSEYSSVKIGYSKDYAFDFNFALEYGELKGKENLSIQRQAIDDYEYYYSGYHKSSGKNKLTISSEYGDIILNRVN